MFLKNEKIYLNLFFYYFFFYFQKLSCSDYKNKGIKLFKITRKFSASFIQSDGISLSEGISLYW